MYAIVDIQGQQFKVEKEKKVFVHRLENTEGSQVAFDQVLLVDQDGKVSVGTPTVKGASVNATVVSHLKGDKTLVFKKKRRKGYQKLNGHRQSFTEILIEDIVLGGTTKKSETAAKAEPAKEAKTDSSETEKSAAKSTTESKAKKPADQKEPAKETKAAAPKSGAKKSTTQKAKSTASKSSSTTQSSSTKKSEKSTAAKSTKPKSTTAAKKKTGTTQEKKSTGNKKDNSSSSETENE